MTMPSRTLTGELSGRTRISYEEFLQLPDDINSEWVDGRVVPFPPVTVEHARIVSWLSSFMASILWKTGSGEVLLRPFQMKNHSGRSPDLLVILSKSAGRLRNQFLDGPADLVVEVVSPSGARRDYVEKFREYEEAGVQEYWIIDPERREVLFFVANNGRFEGRDAVDGVYASAAVPGLWLRESWIWERPNPVEAAAEVLAARG